MSLPDGYSAPAYEISSDDRSGLLVIINGNALILVLFFLALRTCKRLPSLTALTLDDVTIVAASILAVIQIALNFYATSHGFGKKTDKLDAESKIEIQKALYASDLIYLISLCLSKLSSFTLAQRLSPDRQYQIMMNSSLALTIVTSIISVVLIALGCESPHPWMRMNHQCTNLFPRWLVISIFNILLEMLLFAEVIHLISGVQKPWSGKFKGVIAFGMRLQILPLTILRLVAIYLQSRSTNPYFSGILTACWTQAELSYSIAASTIVCVTPFMMKLNTNMGAMDVGTVNNTGHSYSNQGGTSKSYQLRRNVRPNRHADVTLSEDYSNNAGVRTTVLASSNPRHHSMSSDCSTREIIRKDVNITLSIETGV